MARLCLNLKNFVIKIQPLHKQTVPVIIIDDEV